MSNKKIVDINVYDDQTNEARATVSGTQRLNQFINGLGNAIAKLLDAVPEDMQENVSMRLLEAVVLNLKKMEDK